MKKVIINKTLNPNNLASSMGCRTYNGWDINFNFKDIMQDCLNGKIVDQYSANQKDGRGNLAPVTIILPTLAMEAGRDVEQFMALLNTKLYEAKDMLLERYKGMCAQSPDAAKFMYENGTMLGYHPGQGIESALKHGTLVVGWA